MDLLSSLRPHRECTKGAQSTGEIYTSTSPYCLQHIHPSQSGHPSHRGAGGQPTLPPSCWVSRERSSLFRLGTGPAQGNLFEICCLARCAVRKTQHSVRRPFSGGSAAAPAVQQQQRSAFLVRGSSRKPRPACCRARGARVLSPTHTEGSCSLVSFWADGCLPFLFARRAYCHHQEATEEQQQRE